MYYRQSLRDQKKRVLLIIGIVIIIACCIGFYPFTQYMSDREQARVTPKPTPVPDTFTGRLILLGSASEEMFQVYSLAGDADGSYAPQGGQFPGMGSVQFISPSGNLAVVMSTGESAVLDLTSGKRRVIIHESVPDIVGAFSPDDRYLVLGIRPSYYQNWSTQLLLFDLSTNSEPVVLYDAPSARYGSIATSASGSVWQPLWLDAETLIFSSYVGAMPEQITTVSGAHEILPPNSTSLLRIVEGEIVSHRIISQSKIYDFSRAGAVSAGGVLTGISISSGVENPPSWLDLAKLKQGSLQNYQPFAKDSEWFGRIPDFISPDGRYAVFTDTPMDSPVFHLVGISSGTKIGSASFTDKAFERFSPRECLDLSWSPDMQSLACRANGRLVILSFPTGRAFALKVDLAGISPWRLLTWQP